MTPTQPVSIDGIEFDALIDSEEKHEATVPEYPVETGYSVSDNIAIGAMELSMTLYLTATPITWRDSHGIGMDRLSSIPNQLLNKYEQRELISVVTQEKTYANMAISSISIKKDADTGLAREIPITLTQVTTTSSEKVEIPASLPHSGTTKTSAGTASTGTASTTESAGSSGGSSGGSEGGSGGNAGSSGSSSSSGQSGSALHYLYKTAKGASSINYGG